MGTIIFPVNPVDVDVLLEGNELVEFDPTDRTVVRSFFRGVDLNVTRQGGVGQESFSAVCAGQRFGFVSAVNSHVFLEINSIHYKKLSAIWVSLSNPLQWRRVHKGSKGYTRFETLHFNPFDAYE